MQIKSSIALDSFQCQSGALCGSNGQQEIRKGYLTDFWGGDVEDRGLADVEISLSQPGNVLPLKVPCRFK